MSHCNAARCIVAVAAYRKTSKAINLKSVTRRVVEVFVRSLLFCDDR